MHRSLEGENETSDSKKGIISIKGKGTMSTSRKGISSLEKKGEYVPWGKKSALLKAKMNRKEQRVVQSSLVEHKKMGPPHRR